MADPHAEAVEAACEAANAEVSRMHRIGRARMRSALAAAFQVEAAETERLASVLHRMSIDAWLRKTADELGVTS